MQTEIEFEAKRMVSKEDFYRILHIFSKKERQEMVQENHYFETPTWQLKKASTSLRIRKKNGRYTMTLKKPHTEGILEMNETISSEEANAAISHNMLPQNAIYRQLCSFPFSDLTYIGMLQTKRTTICAYGGTLFFDENNYLQKTDYEIEFEGNDEAHAEERLTTILHEAGCKNKEALPKIYRFIKRKRQLSK